VQHGLYLYSSDKFPALEIAEYLACGFRKQESALILATKAHRDEIEQCLAAREVDADAWADEGRILFMEANEALERVQRKGVLDARKVRAVLGSAVHNSLGTFGARRCRVFGELVALLAERNELKSALALERCWNDLKPEYSFDLRCAYPYSVFFEDRSVPGFCDICDEHDGVFPEGLDNPPSEIAPQWLGALAMQCSRLRDMAMKCRAAEDQLQEREVQLAELLELALSSLAGRHSLKGSRDQNRWEELLEQIYWVCAGTTRDREKVPVGSAKWERYTGEILGYGKLVAYLAERCRRAG